MKIKIENFCNTLYYKLYSNETDFVKKKGGSRPIALYTMRQIFMLFSETRCATGWPSLLPPLRHLLRSYYKTVSWQISPRHQGDNNCLLKCITKILGWKILKNSVCRYTIISICISVCLSVTKSRYFDNFIDSPIISWSYWIWLFVKWQTKWKDLKCL